MRILERDKSYIFVAKYDGKREVMDNGLRTGEYDLSYSNPNVAKVYVSVPKSTRQSGFGNRESTAYGNDTHYVRNIVSEKDLGLTINDLVWIGIPSTSNIDGGEMWGNDADTIDGGTMWNSSEPYFGGLFVPWETVQGEKPNYQIQSIGKSFHHVVYSIRQI